MICKYLLPPHRLSFHFVYGLLLFCLILFFIFSLFLLSTRISLGILSSRVQEFSWIEWNQLQGRAEKKGLCNSEAQRRSCLCVAGRGRSCLLPCPLLCPQTAGPAGRQGHRRGNRSLADQCEVCSHAE